MSDGNGNGKENGRGNGRGNGKPKRKARAIAANGKSTRAVGRPRKIDEGKRKEILAIVSVGGSRNDAARYVGIDPATISHEVARNQEFLTSLTRAEAACKIRHIRVLAEAGDWRASLAFLARKWPEEWSEAQRFHHNHRIDLSAEGVTVVTDDSWFDTARGVGGDESV